MVLLLQSNSAVKHNGVDSSCVNMGGGEAISINSHIFIQGVVGFFCFVLGFVCLFCFFNVATF